ncbi:MAG: hypothetical protein KH269_05325 [Faecalibacterium prausnitzii]|nr:hypothetical protein [Faecalibacterium prausnitzii]
MSNDELHPSKHIKTVIALFVPTIAMQVYTVLDKTMIGVITKNAYENGYYKQALKIAKLVLTIVTSVAETTIAIIQIYIVRKELSPFEIVKCGTHYYIAGGIMLAVLLLIRESFSASIIHTFELVIIGTVIYGAALLVMKDEFLLSNVNNILKKVIKRT